MAKKKDTDPPSRKDELQKQLKKKNSSLEKLKRELKIEAALEKVRARTMAMRRSDELLDTSQLFFQQIRELGETVVQASIAIVNEEAGSVELSSSIQGKHLPLTLNVPIDDPYVMSKGVAAWKAKQRSLALVFKGQELKNYNERRNSFLETKINFPEDQWVVNLSFFSKGWLSFSSNKNVTGETTVMMKRFAAVIEQTYTRFLDLQKAEAQTREAQIEAALERVRFHTMAMNNSDDVGIATIAMFSELEKLELKNIRVGIAIFRLDQTAEVWSFMKTEEGKTVRTSGTLDMNATVVWKQFYKGWQQKEDLFHYFFAGEEKKAYYKVLSNSPNYSLSGEMPELPDQHFQSYYFPEGAIWTYSLNLHSEEHKQILKKFTAVFSLTFRRYQDLKKAEAQSRESQIQLALERVRARSMAMYNSQELHEVAEVLFQQLLNFGGNILNAGVALCKADADEDEFWVSSDTGIRPLISIPHTDDPIQKKLYEGWKNKLEFYSESKGGDELKAHYNYLASVPSLKLFFQEGDLNRSFPTWQKWHAAYFSHGYVFLMTTDEYDEEKILVRFAKTFEQAYTRFLDLQKAEAQAREAKIEAALEKVRGNAMAMHSSEDLATTIQVFYHELVDLSSTQIIRCGVGLLNKENYIADVSSISKTSDGTLAEVRGKLDMKGSSMLKECYENWLIQKEYQHLLRGNEIKKHYQYMRGQVEIPDYLDDATQYFYFPMFNEGSFYVVTENELSLEDMQTYRRFVSVLSLTYKRYNDLQKAEAQSRESQIQLSLERVRARTMAMHSSEDVTSAAETMFEELKKLGINCLRGGVANIRPDKTMVAFGITNTDGKTMKGFSFFDMNLHPLWKRLFESWNGKEEIFIGYLAGREKEDYLNIVNSRQNYLPQSIVQFPDTHFQSYYFDQGNIWTYSLQPHNEADKEIMKRFASGFALTFRRYQDLKKAEAQAKEAQIEAALERVRSKAMSMQKSEDLSNAVAIVFDELEKMDLGAIRCGISIINKEDHTTKIWSTTKAAEGTAVQVSGDESMDIHPLLKGAFNAWSQLKDFSYVLKNDDLTDFYTALSNTNFKLPDHQNDSSKNEQYMYVAHFPVGGLYVFKGSDFSDDIKKVIKRFGEVFNLTYTRYNDLQIAEASAKEAIRQAALDRIRADIASMRTTKDLERITPLIWSELTVLGIPFIRCGVFIMDEEQKQIHTFLSTPDGKAIAAFHIPYDTPGNIKLVISNWENHKKYTDHWDEDAFTTFAETIVKQGALASSEQYLQTIPHGGFYLHFLPFLQGMLYVGNTTQLSEEEINLIQSIADAFSTAYARYEDFNKLESAKQQIEKTLVDLKQAQSQLIQSEKMASLGELTAGIAHEIQNPLNFVNNFSEVNKELISELVDEVNKGNTDEVKVIAKDIKENSEKINHHGKRADAIVKGMLQHSRSSAGVKEPTDINALADEYLRLAYHGLRAKDNSFNAKIETDLDKNIGKINIIPQDIGRVLLNLYNNAFYTINEKQNAERLKQNAEYHPTVSVQTKKINDKVALTVMDNGNSIPQKVVDKIFQPFFTTKPTGQGTGLGLSLSYDIIKAHSGEIKVETKEGEGTTFIIQLPA